MKELKRISIKAVIDKDTPKEKIQEDALILSEKEDKTLAVWIDKGVTGYESFNVDTGEDFFERFVEKSSKNGWWACAGTKGSWPSMYITGEDMKKMYIAFGIAKEK